VRKKLRDFLVLICTVCMQSTESMESPRSPNTFFNFFSRLRRSSSSLLDKERSPSQSPGSPRSIEGTKIPWGISFVYVHELEEKKKKNYTENIVTINETQYQIDLGQRRILVYPKTVGKD